MIGVFGGSGFYSFLEDVEELDVETPYGPPSAPVAMGEVAGQRVAFVPRHGRNHELPPHSIPFRANVWAMRESGVRRIIGPCASGALTRELESGTSSSATSTSTARVRVGTRSTTGRRPRTSPPPTRSAPICVGCWSRRRASGAIPVREGGTVVVIQGPRFSTRAESVWFQSAGWDAINMTAYPECHLARELELCYATIAMVTDYDVGVGGEEAVSAAQVVQVLQQNNERLRDLLLAVIPKIGPQPDDICASALREARL